MSGSVMTTEGGQVDDCLTVEDLSADQLREIMAGDPITFPASEACPMEVGDVLVLEQTSGIAFTPEEIEAQPELAEVASVTTPILWLTVTEIRRTRKMLWRVIYGFTDHRPLWMRKGPPKGDGTRLKQQRWTPVDEHGLTPNLVQAFDPEAETVPGQYQNVIEMRARLRAAERRELDAEKDLQRVQAATRDLAKRAAKMGVDPMIAMAPLQKAIEEAQQGLSEEVA